MAIGRRVRWISPTIARLFRMAGSGSRGTRRRWALETRVGEFPHRESCQSRSTAGFTWRPLLPMHPRDRLQRRNDIGPFSLSSSVLYLSIAIFTFGHTSMENFYNRRFSIPSNQSSLRLLVQVTPTGICTTFVRPRAFCLPSFREIVTIRSYVMRNRVFLCRSKHVARIISLFFFKGSIVD